MGTSFRPQQSGVQDFVRLVMGDRQFQAQQQLAERQMMLQELLNKAGLARLLGEEGQQALAAGDMAGVINAMPQSMESIRDQVVGAGAQNISPEQQQAMATLMLSGQMPEAFATSKILTEAAERLDPEKRTLFGEAGIARRTAGVGQGDLKREQVYMDMGDENILQEILVGSGLAPDAKSLLAAQVDQYRTDAQTAVNSMELRLRQMLGEKGLQIQESELNFRKMAWQIESLRALQGNPDYAKIYGEINSTLKMMESGEAQAKEIGVMLLDRLLREAQFPGITNPQGAKDMVDNPWFGSGESLFKQGAARPLTQPTRPASSVPIPRHPDRR